MTAASDPLYDELVALAEVSLELVRDGQLEPLEHVHEAAFALVEKLPPVPSQAAAPKLQRVAALNEEKVRLLEQGKAVTRQALSRIADGRRALGGYAPGPPSSRRARVDATG
jgi:hypothetical protein